MNFFKIKGIDENDIFIIREKLTDRGFTTLRCEKMAITASYWDPYDYDSIDAMLKIGNVLSSENYDYLRFSDGISNYTAIYSCSKRYNSLYERCKQQLNSTYGFSASYVINDEVTTKQAYDAYFRNKYHGGYKKRHGDIYKVKAIYNGIERATGKFKTVVEWYDGTKTIITKGKDDNHLNRVLAFSYAWVKKQYGSNSAFKRHVDKHVENWGYMGQIFFDDGDYQAQLSVRTKSNDIYDQVALVMTFKDFGGIEVVNDILEVKTYE